MKAWNPDASNCLDVMLTAMSSSYSFVGLWAGQQLGQFFQQGMLDYGLTKDLMDEMDCSWWSQHFSTCI